MVPLLDIGGLLARIGVVILSRLGVILMMLAPLDDLLEDRLVDLNRIRQQTAVYRSAVYVGAPAMKVQEVKGGPRWGWGQRWK